MRLFVLVLVLVLVLGVRGAKAQRVGLAISNILRGKVGFSAIKLGYGDKDGQNSRHKRRQDGGDQPP